MKRELCCFSFGVLSAGVLAISSLLVPAHCQAQEQRREELPFRERRRPPFPFPRPAGEPRSTIGPAKMISMNFDKADIVAVLKLLANAAGVTMAISPQLEGTVTITATTDIPIAEAFEVMNSILRVRGYTMIGGLQDRVIQVVPLKEAITYGTQVSVGQDVGEVSGDAIITQIIPIRNADATKLKEDLAPMISKENAALMANAASNTLVVTDTRANVRRILEVVRELDRDVRDVITMDVIYLQFGNAPSIAETLKTMLEETAAKKAQGRQPPQEPPQPGQKVETGKGFVEMRGEIKIAADARTNAIIVWATKEKIELIKGLVSKLDINVSPDVKVKVFPLQNADATSLAAELNQIFEQPQGPAKVETRVGIRMPWDFRYPEAPQPTGQPGLAGLKENYIVPDVRTNSLIVTAREENMEAIGELIDKLDRERSISEVTRVYKLIHAKAADIAETLTGLFQGAPVRGGFFSFLYRLQTMREGPLATLREVTVVAEPKSNSVIVTGPPQVFDTITKMIEALDTQQSQVFIEVLIVDVTLDDKTQLGIEWNILTGSDEGDSVSTNFGVAGRSTGLRYSVVGSDVTALLQTLIEQKKVKVVSTPHITTMDNVEASIEIGQQFPIVKGFSVPSTGQAIPQFELTPITLKLTVTPHITTSQFITMEITQKIDELAGTTPQGEFQLPIISKREAKTSVTVEDGQTIIIGGIMKDTTSKTTRKVPLLGDIPGLGALFRDDEKITTRSELMVFLTPHIVNTQADVNQITQRKKSELQQRHEKPKEVRP